MNPTKNSLSPEIRLAMVQCLNERLIDLLDLQLRAKQAHWNVKGSNFIGVHGLFDSVYGEVEGFVDTVAERAAALGGVVDGTVQTVAAKTRLMAYPVGITAWQDHVGAISQSLSDVGGMIRTSLDYAQDHHDIATVDVFTEILRGLDKLLWFVESHLQG